MFGWLMSMLAQDVGFPVPHGGAQQLADSLARRFQAGTGSVRTGSRVTDVIRGRAPASGWPTGAE